MLLQENPLNYCRFQVKVMDSRQFGAFPVSGGRIKTGRVHEAWESGDGPGGQYAGCEAVICQRHS